MSLRRVVVTGLGLLTPLGVGVSPSWTGITEGKSGIKQITEFDTSNLSSKIAGLIDRSPENGFNPENFIDPKDIRKMDRFIQYGIAAAIEAVENSGWKPEDEQSRDSTGVMLG